MTEGDLRDWYEEQLNVARAEGAQAERERLRSRIKDLEEGLRRFVDLADMTSSEYVARHGSTELLFTFQSGMNDAETTARALLATKTEPPKEPDWSQMAMATSDPLAGFVQFDLARARYHRKWHNQNPDHPCEHPDQPIAYEP